MDTITLIAIGGGVVGVVLCIFVCYFCCAHSLVKKRTEVIELSSPVRYLPPPVFEEQEVFDNREPLTTMEKRRFRIKKFNDELAAAAKSRSKTRSLWLYLNTKKTNKDKKKKATLEKTSSLVSLARFVSFRSLSAQIDLEEGAGDSSDDDTKAEESVKKKRYVSEEGMAKREARKKREQEQEDEVIEVENDIETEGVQVRSLLSLDIIREDYRDNMISDRVQRRKDKKLFVVKGGMGMDAVSINSGPPESRWTPGLHPSKWVPRICNEDLLKKPVMWYWEGNPRCTGWFPGRISSESRKEGCNYNIQYERWITKNVFVDGIRNVDLTLSGDNAYGRRWVIMIPDGKDEEFGQSVPPWLQKSPEEKEKKIETADTASGEENKSPL